MIKKSVLAKLILRCSVSGVSHTSQHRIASLDTASIYRLPPWSLPSAAPASGPFRSRVHWQRGHHHFVGFPSAMLSVGRPAQPTWAHLLSLMFPSTMLSVGYPQSPSVAEGWALLGYFDGNKIVWSLKTPSQVRAFWSAPPLCFHRSFWAAGPIVLIDTFGWHIGVRTEFISFYFGNQLDSFVSDWEHNFEFQFSQQSINQRFIVLGQFMRFVKLFQFFQQLINHFIISVTLSKCWNSSLISFFPRLWFDLLLTQLPFSFQKLGRGDPYLISTNWFETLSHWSIRHHSYLVHMLPFWIDATRLRPLNNNRACEVNSKSVGGCVGNVQNLSRGVSQLRYIF